MIDLKGAKLINLIKDNKVHFDFYQDKTLYYYLLYQGYKYIFPITVEEAKGGCFTAEDKAILFMRWIRKSIEADEMIVEPIK